MFHFEAITRAYGAWHKFNEWKVRNDHELSFLESDSLWVDTIQRFLGDFGTVFVEKLFQKLKLFLTSTK